MLLRRTAALGLVLALAACKGASSSSAKGEGSDVVLAKGEGVTITAADFRALLEEQQPFQRAQMNAPGRKQALLKRMVQEEILYRQAEKEGLKDDPQVRKLLRSFMVQRLAQQRARNTDPASVPDADVQKYFQERSGDYQKRVAASIIAFHAAAGAPERAQKRAAATKALAEIRAAEKGATATATPRPASTRSPAIPPPAASSSVSGVFSKLVSQLSDDESTKRFGGSLGFKTRAELEKTHPAELVAALFAMPQNQVSDVIETPQGFYIARVNALREEQTLEQVRPQIQMRLARQADEKAWTDFVEKLQTEAAVQIDEKALESVEVPPLQPAAGASNRPLPSPPPPANAERAEKLK